MMFVLWEWLKSGLHRQMDLLDQLNQEDHDEQDNELAKDLEHLNAAKQRAWETEKRLLTLEFQKAFIDHGNRTAH